MESNEVYYTQGGGLVQWDESVKRYVFVDPPEGFNIGDFMPEEWGIV